MGQKHKVKIEKIFEHPVSGNIDTKKLISALEHYGAQIEFTKSNRVKMVINGEELVSPLASSHVVTKDEVVKLRHFLEKVGLTPDKL